MEHRAGHGQRLCEMLLIPFRSIAEIKNKKVLLRDHKRHLLRIVQQHSLSCSAKGGTPSCPVRGYPYPVQGSTHILARGTPCCLRDTLSCLGVPISHPGGDLEYPPPRRHLGPVTKVPQKGPGTSDWGTPLLTDRHL